MGLCVAALVSACGKPAETPQPVRAVRTLVVSEVGGTSEREYSGEIRARVESQMGFQVPGKVVRRLVNVGDVVKAGQVLAQLDPADLRLGAQAAQAGLAAAQAQASQAEANLRRFTELKQQGFISEAQLDNYQTAARAARAQLDQAKAQSGVQANQALVTGSVFQNSYNKSEVEQMQAKGRFEFGEYSGLDFGVSAMEVQNRSASSVRSFRGTSRS